MVAAPGTIDEQLLNYVISWYISVASPTVSDDHRLFANLQSANRQDALTAIGSIMSSVSLPHHVVGLSSAIKLGLGAESAISAVAEELTALASSSKFPDLLGAIGTYYVPNQVSSLAALEQLIELHTSVPGVDAAAASALQKLGSKAVASAMAELLDSQDQQAQLRAATFFGFYSLFADAQGNLP